jgi:hypothetical protein
MMGEGTGLYREKFEALFGALGEEYSLSRSSLINAGVSLYAFGHISVLDVLFFAPFLIAIVFKRVRAFSWSRLWLGYIFCGSFGSLCSSVLLYLARCQGSLVVFERVA